MDRARQHTSNTAVPATESYEPPAVTYLGDLADLTRADKTTGSADGSTFLGLDIGS